jgi:3-phosphoglycerate kinase
MKIKSIKKIKNIKGKKIFHRVDFNVPIKNGSVKDDFKIINTLPSIRFLLRYKCKIILSSHLGRPKGKKNLDYTLEPVAKRLSEVLDKKVKFVEDCIGLQVGSEVAKMKEGEILLLENIRFYQEELDNNTKFARELASYSDIYVNDSFGVNHRKQASLSAIKQFLPAYAGLLVENEIEKLNKILKPKKPMVIVIGGSKIKTKLPLIKNLYSKTHRFLIGGILANNFLKAMNFETGKSITDEKSVKIAKKLLGEKIILPIDFIIGNKNKEHIKSVSANKINKNDIIYDIGPETVKLYSKYLNNAQTIVWNGPLGMYENKNFQFGTFSIARIIAAKSNGKAFGVTGGGETVDALKMTKMQDNIDWISTGGGAMLSYLGGEKMPGLSKIIK